MHLQNGVTASLLGLSGLEEDQGAAVHLSGMVSCVLVDRKVDRNCN